MFRKIARRIYETKTTHFWGKCSEITKVCLTLPDIRSGKDSLFTRPNKISQDQNRIRVLDLGFWEILKPLKWTNITNFFLIKTNDWKDPLNFLFNKPSIFVPDSRSGGNQYFFGPNWLLPDFSIGPACLGISECFFY
jgi:hypothetical protein